MADLPIPLHSGSEDLGEHDEPQHAPSSHKAAPSGFVSFPHEGGALAEPRMAAVGTGGPSPRGGPKIFNDAVPALTTDPNATAKVFVEEGTAGHEKLEQLTDKELLTRAVRELAITGIMISRALQGQVDALVPSKVGELTGRFGSQLTRLGADKLGSLLELKYQAVSA